MTHKTTLRSAVCLAALLPGSVVMAEVSAQQVWDDWKTELTLFGDNLSVTAEDVSGDSLIVRGVTMTNDDAGTSSFVDLGDLTFTEQGDGSVSVTMAESFPVVITGDDGVIITVIVSQPGLELTVSGTPDALDYVVNAPSFSVVLQDIVDGDVPFAGTLQMIGTNLTGTYATRTGETRDMTYDMAVDAVDILVDMKQPSSKDDYITGGGKISGITLQAEVSTPANVDFSSTDNPFADGMEMAFGYTTQGAEFVFDASTNEDAAAGSITFGTANLSAGISGQTVSYVTKSNDIAVNMTTSDVPFPIEIGLAEYGVTFEMPLAPAEDPQPFALGFDLVDVTVSEMIWSLLDPNAVLPRDAATIQFGLSGLARPLFDMMDPQQEAAMWDSDMPFELVEIALTKLNVVLAGATMTGEGAFSFDNTDMVTFAPLPRPEGQVSAQVNGLNTLMDNLVTMGLIPADQIMAPRMMMGMFARSTGNDQLETTLEVTADGQVLANGQRIR